MPNRQFGCQAVPFDGSTAVQPVLAASRWPVKLCPQPFKRMLPAGRWDPAYVRSEFLTARWDDILGSACRIGQTGQRLRIGGFEEIRDLAVKLSNLRLCR